MKGITAYDAVCRWIRVPALVDPAPSCFDCIKHYEKIMPKEQARLSAEITGQATTNGNIWLCMAHFNKRVAHGR